MNRRVLLFHLAEDAFDVLNWARREGLKRDKQLEQVVEAYEKTLADNHANMAEKAVSLASAQVQPLPLPDQGSGV